MDAGRQVGDHNRQLGGHGEKQLLRLIRTTAVAQIGMLQHQIDWIDEYLNAQTTN